jgi:hypothetical protein
MFSTRSRAVAALAAGAILLAPLAGCGGGDSKDAKKNTSSHGSSAADKTSTSIDDFVTKLTDAMQQKRTAKLELELGSSMSATADVDYADSGTRMALKMITGSQVVRVVLADGAMYLQQTKGSKYLKIDKDDPALGSLLKQVGSIGPKASVSGLKAGIKKISDRGTETVDGEKLTHYVLTVDTSKVSTTFGAPSNTADMPKTITYDVYVDGADLLRRVKMQVSGQTLVMKVSDWGKPVTITVPPASKVMTR